jgi:uncharacterized membrane protein (DUF2068 family)
MPGDPNTPKAAPNRAPTLYAIIGLKLFKGLFFAVLAMSLYALSDNDLPVEYHNALQWLNRWTHLNPERRFWVDLSTKVNALTERQMVQAAIGTLIYGLFALVEGVGLMFRISWAGWLSIGESAFFIPIEIHEMIHNYSWVVLVVLILNIFMVWYLFQNRERLFHHHHHDPPPAAADSP